MKRILLSAPILLSFALILSALNAVIIWKPSDLDAAWAWNLAIILAPVLALTAQWKVARERPFQMATVLTVIAILNTSIVLGSRLGAWTGTDWMRALSGEGLPDLPGKTVMGGLVLMLLVYFALQRWWRLPSNLADVLALGLPLAAVSGRVGCSLAGCCYGIPTGSDWGISYGPGTPAYLHQVNTGLLVEGAASSLLLFPIQLMLIGGNLLIFMILWIFRKRFSRPGALALLSLGLLTLQRFGIEFLRDVATNRGSFGIMAAGLKMGQWVVLIIAAGCLAGFCYLQFFQKKNTPASVPESPQVGTAPLAYALGGITIGGFLLRDLLTLDEAMVMLVSCLPAIALLGRRLWREHNAGRPVWAPVSMLSMTAILLMTNPLDSIPIKPSSNEWKRWMDVSAGGSVGNYKNINRDCDGNVVKEDIVKVNAGGAEVRANWQKGWTKLQVGVRGAFGNASTNDNNYESDNYRYSDVGIQTSVSNRWIGLSLGVFNRQLRFPEKVGPDYPSRNEFLPSGSLRIGRLDRYSLDFRVFDEPALAISNEPVFTLGLVNWGFNDPSGTTYLRAGWAVTSVVESAFTLSGWTPLGKTGLSGGFSAYLGNANMLGVGLRYRFKER